MQSPRPAELPDDLNGEGAEGQRRVTSPTSALQEFAALNPDADPLDSPAYARRAVVEEPVLQQGAVDEGNLPPFLVPLSADEQAYYNTIEENGLVRPGESPRDAIQRVSGGRLFPSSQVNGPGQQIGEASLTPGFLDDRQILEQADRIGLRNPGETSDEFLARLDQARAGGSREDALNVLQSAKTAEDDRLKAIRIQEATPEDYAKITSDPDLVKAISPEDIAILATQDPSKFEALMPNLRADQLADLRGDQLTDNVISQVGVRNLNSEQIGSIGPTRRAAFITEFTGEQLLQISPDELRPLAGNLHSEALTPDLVINLGVDSFSTEQIAGMPISQLDKLNEQGILDGRMVEIFRIDPVKFGALNQARPVPGDALTEEMVLYIGADRLTQGQLEILPDALLSNISKDIPGNLINETIAGRIGVDNLSEDQLLALSDATLMGIAGSLSPEQIQVIVDKGPIMLIKDKIPGDKLNEEIIAKIGGVSALSSEQIAALPDSLIKKPEFAKTIPGDMIDKTIADRIGVANLTEAQLQNMGESVIIEIAASLSASQLNVIQATFPSLLSNAEFYSKIDGKNLSADLVEKIGVDKVTGPQLEAMPDAELKKIAPKLQGSQFTLAMAQRVNIDSLSIDQLKTMDQAVINGIAERLTAGQLNTLLVQKPELFENPDFYKNISGDKLTQEMVNKIDPVNLTEAQLKKLPVDILNATASRLQGSQITPGIAYRIGVDKLTPDQVKDVSVDTLKKIAKDLTQNQLNALLRADAEKVKAIGTLIPGAKLTADLVSAIGANNLTVEQLNQMPLDVIGTIDPNTLDDNKLNALSDSHFERIKAKLSPEKAKQLQEERENTNNAAIKEFVERGITVDTIFTSIEDVPGFDSLPKPLQDIIIANMKTREDLRVNQNNVDQVKVKEEEASRRLENLKLAKKERELLFRQMKFIFGGVLAGAALGAMLSGAGDLGGLLSIGAIGAGATIGLGGGVAAELIDTEFSIDRAKLEYEIAKSKSKIQENQANLIRIRDRALKRDVSTLAAYSVIAGEIFARGTGITDEAQKKKFIGSFQREMGLPVMNAILAV